MSLYVVHRVIPDALLERTGYHENGHRTIGCRDRGVEKNAGRTDRHAVRLSQVA
jgi:hypothetical protein